MAKDYYRLPQPFLERLKEIVPESMLSQVLLSFCVRRNTTFRVNTLKSDDETVLSELQGGGFALHTVPWMKHAYTLSNLSLLELTNTSAYEQGLLYVQSLSSMIPAFVLDPTSTDTVLDITAAPGSKTTEMAAMMNNSGHIVANDTSFVRRQKLQSNLARQGVTNTIITGIPGQALWHEYPEYFDKSLADVPCSMEGRFFSGDNKTYKDWTLKKIHTLVQIQRFLLRSALSATKPGGCVVYSTCTLAPEENEGVVDWILKKEKGNVELVDLSPFQIPGTDGFLQWAHSTYDTSMAKTKRILPSESTEGFFIAKIKKLHSTIPAIMRPTSY